MEGVWVEGQWAGREEVGSCWTVHLTFRSARVDPNPPPHSSIPLASISPSVSLASIPILHPTRFPPPLPPPWQYFFDPRNHGDGGRAFFKAPRVRSREKQIARRNSPSRDDYGRFLRKGAGGARDGAAQIDSDLLAEIPWRVVSAHLAVARNMDPDLLGWAVPAAHTGEGREGEGAASSGRGGGSSGSSGRGGASSGSSGGGASSSSSGRGEGGEGGGDLTVSAGDGWDEEDEEEVAAPPSKRRRRGGAKAAGRRGARASKQQKAKTDAGDGEEEDQDPAIAAAAAIADAIPPAMWQLGPFPPTHVDPDHQALLPSSSSSLLLPPPPIYPGDQH
jgi:hypothetical protein